MKSEEKRTTELQEAKVTMFISTKGDQRQTEKDIVLCPPCAACNKEK